MSGSGPGTFKTESRRVSDDGPPTRFAIATCCSCPRTGEVSLKDNSPGIAARVLQARGWSLGKRGANKDLCPSCVAGKRRERAARPDNRTPGQKRTAFLIASGRIPGKGGADVTAVAEVPVNNIMAEVLAPVREAMKKAAKLEKAEARPKRSNLSGSGYTSNSNAHASARRFLKGLGIPNAKPEVHYIVTKAADGSWDYDLIEQPDAPEIVQPQQEETSVSDASTQAVRDEERRIAAEPPRSPTPSDNRRILSAFEEHYDAENRRYLKNFSDESVSAKLKMPRAWVTAVREQFDFGPDRNESAEAEVRRLKSALLAAENSAKRLLELASEADTITANLRASLAALGVTV